MAEVGANHTKNEDKDRLVVPACVKKRTFKVGYDNGFTPSSVTNDCGERPNLIRFNQGFEVLGWQVNGAETGAGELLGPFAGWTAQLQGWADFFNLFDPNPNSNAAFGRKPAPTWRYTEITGCDPTAEYGPLRLKRVSDGCLFTVYPAPSISSDVTQMLQRYTRVDCDDVKTTVWCEMDDTPLEEPPENLECFVPCGFVYGDYMDVGDAPECTERVRDLCDDTGAALVNFVLVITDCNGVRTRERWTTASYATADDPDDLVPYVVQGQVVDCLTGTVYVEPPPPCDDFEIVKLYSLSELSGALRDRQWDLGPRNPSLINVAEGRAIRENFDFAAPTTVDADWAGGLSLNDTNNASTVQDAQVLEGYVVVEQGMHLRWFSGSAGYLAVELGECCGDYELQIEGAHDEGTVNPSSTLYLPEGIHAIRLWNIDDYSNTARTAQYSLDGGTTFITDNTPPGVQFTRTKPKETCKQIKVCKPSGLLIGLLSGELVDPADCYECPKACAASNCLTC